MIFWVKICKFVHTGRESVPLLKEIQICDSIIMSNTIRILPGN